MCSWQGDKIWDKSLGAYRDMSAAERERQRIHKMAEAEKKTMPGSSPEEAALQKAYAALLRDPSDATYNELQRAIKAFLDAQPLLKGQ